MEELTLKKRKSTILATLGLIYIKQDRYKEAQSALRKSIKLNYDKAILKYVTDLYQHYNQPEEAYITYKMLFIKNYGNIDLYKKLKENYIAYKGSDKGFKKQLKTIQKNGAKR